MNLLKELRERAGNSNLTWPLVALLMIMLFNLFYRPEFFSIEVKEGHLFGSLIDILNRGAPLMLLSLGMTLVIATGGIDLSVGPVVAIAGATAAYLIGHGTHGQDITNTPLPLVILAALLIATAGGLWNGLLVSRVGLQPIIATLILMTAGRGIAQLITEGQILTVYYSPYHYIGLGHLLALPFTVFVVAAVFLLFWFLTRRTALGLFIESIGVNDSASFYSGISEKNIKLLVYTLSGFCAGIAGLIVSSEIKSADANNAGLWFELDAILAVVLGGTSLDGGRFSLAGSILGALIIQSLTTTIYSVGVPPEVIMVVKAMVIMAVILLQSKRFRQAFKPIIGAFLSLTRRGRSLLRTTRLPLGESASE